MGYYNVIVIGMGIYAVMHFSIGLTDTVIRKVYDRYMKRHRNRKIICFFIGRLHWPGTRDY